MLGGTLWVPATTSSRNKGSQHSRLPSPCQVCPHTHSCTTSPQGQRLPHPPWKTQLMLPGSIHSRELPEAATPWVRLRVLRGVGKGWNCAQGEGSHPREPLGTSSPTAPEPREVSRAHTRHQSALPTLPSTSEAAHGNHPWGILMRRHLCSFQRGNGFKPAPPQPHQHHPTLPPPAAAQA